MGSLILGLKKLTFQEQERRLYSNQSKKHVQALVDCKANEYTVWQSRLCKPQCRELITFRTLLKNDISKPEREHKGNQGSKEFWVQETDWLVEGT